MVSPFEVHRAAFLRNETSKKFYIDHFDLQSTNIYCMILLQRTKVSCNLKIIVSELVKLAVYIVSTYFDDIFYCVKLSGGSNI